MNNEKTKSLYSLFKSIKYSKDYLEKIEILKTYKYQDLLLNLLNLNYNQFLKINYTKFNINNSINDLNNKNSTKDSDSRLSSFLLLLCNESKKNNEELEGLIKKCNIKEIKIYNHIIDKSLFDLPLSIINKLFPQLISYPTRFMSCTHYKSTKDLTFPILCEPIQRGVRVKITASLSNSISYNKNYKVCSKLFSDFERELIVMAKRINSKVSVDCEVFYKTYHSTVSCFDEILDNPINYKINVNLFDFIVENKKECILDRKKHLKNYLKLLYKSKITNPRPMLNPYFLLHNIEEISNIYKSSLKAGYFNLILKNPNSIYDPDDINSWVKYNVTYKNAEIIDIIRIKDDDGRKYCTSIVVKCKGEIKNIVNMSPIQRYSLATKRSRIIGSICEIEKEEGNYRFIKLIVDKGKII